MAYIWHLTAQFADEASAVRFQNMFNRNTFMAAGKEVYLQVAVEKNAEWECHILPYCGANCLNGHGGPSDSQEIRELQEAGDLLYKRLRHAPPFRNAIVGVEVGDWLSKAEFLERAKDGEFEQRASAYHGLVVSVDFWKELGEPSTFVPFGEGNMWIPWRGPAAD